MTNKPAELIPFTFKDTGVTVLIRKVSPLLAMELQRSFPPPPPPMNKVDFGDGVIREEPNEADPAYLKKLSEYNQEFELKIRRMLIKRGVVLEITEEMKVQIEELREFWHDEYGIDFPESDDKLAYVWYIAIGTDQDLRELLDAIMRRSQPTQEAEELARKTFQG